MMLFVVGVINYDEKEMSKTVQTAEVSREKGLRT